MSLNVIPWVVYPYLALVSFVAGHIWRWKADRFTITTKSNQPLERKWLLRGSIFFHLGLLGVMVGHVVGLLVPPSVTEELGISERAYHLQAVVVGGVDSLCGSVLFGFNSLELISREPCRPFDAARNGINIGEAAAFALLERAGEGRGSPASASPAMRTTCPPRTRPAAARGSP